MKLKPYFNKKDQCFTCPLKILITYCVQAQTNECTPWIWIILSNLHYRLYFPIALKIQLLIYSLTLDPFFSAPLALIIGEFTILVDDTHNYVASQLSLTNQVSNSEAGLHPVPGAFFIIRCQSWTTEVPS